jgi:hypothetical protein
MVEGSFPLIIVSINIFSAKDKEARIEFAIDALSALALLRTWL